MILVLLGPPGAGKGTQGERLARRIALDHVSTGDLFRDAVTAGSPAGLRAESYLLSGQLVPDQVVLQVIEEYLGHARGRDMCFDGFPRTRNQAEKLDDLLRQFNLSLTAAIYIDVPDHVALRRLLSRGRADDTEETARYRLQVYHQDTEPLIDYYRQAGVLIEVSGVGDVESVARRLWTTFKAAIR
ncbi:MAG: adenylate kinase [Chloroflexi bacterium]|nr:adenylate kinase [Chloroflexota bacterium]MCY3958027.1 adenylate kinase [Chloroflexota bacterium]